MTDRMRGTIPRPSTRRDVSPDQLTLPLLDPADAGTIHAAAEAMAGAVARCSRPHEAAELARLRDELVDLLARNAARVRGAGR